LLGAIALVVLAAVGLTSATVSAARPNVTVFDMVLTGAEEVSPPGDPDGIGFARVILDEGSSTICIVSRVRNVALPLTLAHIHRAPRGQNGPVVVDFTSLINNDRVRGCVSASSELITRIKNNPGNYYVNIHNAEFRPGAVRGQLGE
jgi:hypothetical protein